MKDNENSVLLLEFIKTKQLDIKSWNSSIVNRLHIIRIYEIRNEIFAKRNNIECDLFMRIIISLKDIDCESISLFSFTFNSGKLAFGFISNGKIVFYSEELG